MRKYASWLAAAALLLAGAGCTGSTTTDVAPPAAPQAEAQGRAVFTVTDAAVGLTGVTAVELTVNKLEVHSAEKGWVTVSTTPKTYDLLELKRTASAALLADANLAVGTYQQVRLEIGKVLLTVDGKTQEAKLPSNNLKIVGNLTVAEGQTTTAELDFMVDKSLHLTGSGKYVLAPVVRLLTKTSASVKVESEARVKIEGGATETDETAGMDEEGEMKEDFELKEDLEIEADGSVKLELGD